MRLNFKKLGLLAGKAARIFADQAELTPQRIDMLLQLRGWRLNQTELAARLCVTPPVVSRMLDALVELELVVRTVDPQDRRKRYPQITQKGLDRLARCFPGPTWHGAQDKGEMQWLNRWRSIIAEFGIRVDSMIRSRIPDCYASFAAKQELAPNWFWEPWKYQQPY